MIDGYAPLAKAALLRQIAESRRELEDLLSQVEAVETNAGRERVSGEWSANDIRAHILAYERWILDQMGGVTRRIPDPPPDVDLADLDQRNAWFHSLDRDRSPEDVAAEAADVYRRLLERIEATPDDALVRVFTVNPRGNLQAYSAIEADWTGWPLWRWIVSDTFDHYEQHVPDLRRRLEAGDQRIRPTGWGRT